MHIPPYYKKPKWQAFFIGVLSGAVIGYLIFLYMYGEHTERWIEENLTLRNEINNLEQDYELLKDDTNQLSEENEKKLSIQNIEIEFLNAKELKLDRFTTLPLTELVEGEINTIIGQNIMSVYEQRNLILRTIENKTFKINNINYTVKVKILTIAPTTHLSLNISLNSS